MNDCSHQEIPLHLKLQRLATEEQQQPLTIGDVLKLLETAEKGYGIPLLLLSLPGALPMPAVGINTPLGVVVILLGLQMLSGKRSMWLPDRFIAIRLRPDWLRRTARMGDRFLPGLERFVKPRWNWMKYRSGTALLGVAVMLLGVLMLMPIPGTNTLPAIDLLVLSFGLIESDGLLTLIATLLAVILSVLYVEAFYLLIGWLVG